MASSSRTIGVFDSGVGGLSVLKHIRATLPDANLIYVADSGHVPYGDKSPAYIEARSIALTRFLVSQGAEAIVIACNTATAAAAHSLRVKFSKLPIVAMEPAVKPAVAATRSGVVGVLATVGTLESARFAALLEKYGGKVKIVTQGCPGLVEVVERGDLHSNEARRLIERYTEPLLKHSADTLILGCTHYPFLAPLIHEVVGDEVALIDTGAAVARELKRRVDVELPMRTLDTARGTVTFYTSGEAEQATRIMSVLWGNVVEVGQLPQEFI
ncbi:MAG: glutamate racemase [Sideroxydans sp. GWF2_59_14]|nr:MAG: glutamate racemase [Sideroxydans sp. GWF2_59_14]HAF45829.1 glutamate racemase [Gallionellaceae bacterium]